jgi:hypothetical protein
MLLNFQKTSEINTFLPELLIDKVFGFAQNSFEKQEVPACHRNRGIYIQLLKSMQFYGAV